MEETTRALIIVDVQPPFCEGGALAVEGGNVVAEKIADFVQDNLDEYALIVTTQDWHINPGSHFSDTPDFVDTWPPHGVAGTPEAELHEAIASLPIDVEVKKGEYAAAYSGFEGVEGRDRSLEDILRVLLVDAPARGLIHDDGTSRDLFGTALMGRLTPRPSHEAKAQMAYNSQPCEDRDKKDLRYILGVGWSF